jgi:hypothetical protein
MPATTKFSSGSDRMRILPQPGASGAHVAAALVVAGAGDELRPAGPAGGDAGEEVRAGVEVEPAVGIGHDAPDRLRGGAVDDGGPHGLADDLALVFPQARDAGRREEAAQHERRPVLAARGGDPAGVEVTGEASEGFADDEPLGDLADDVGLVGADGDAVVLEPEGPPAATGDLPVPGEFEVLGFVALRLVLGFVSSRSAKHAGHHAAGGG